MLADDFEESLLAKHLFQAVPRVGQAIGIDDQNVLLVEAKSLGLIRCAGEHPYNAGAGRQLFDFPRCAAEQVSWIVPGADERPYTIGLENEQLASSAGIVG